MHTSPQQSADASRRQPTARPARGKLALAGRPSLHPAPAPENDTTSHADSWAEVHGREDELGELADSFQRAAAGSIVFFLLSGRAGVGKKALVRALRGIVCDQGGRMLEGCFVRDRRHSPYTGLAEAIADLVDQINAEPAPQRDLWRTRLIDGLGTHCALLAEMVPALRRLSGPTAPAAELPWPAASQRMEQAFRRLISLCATRASGAAVPRRPPLGGRSLAGPAADADGGRRPREPDDRRKLPGRGFLQTLPTLYSTSGADGH